MFMLVYDAAIRILIGLLLVPYAFLQGGTALVRARLGRIPRAASGARRVLVHAVSAGEMRATAALIDALPADFSVVLSAGNDDAIRAAEEIARTRPRVERVVAFPWDGPGIMRRWLTALEIERAVVVETEIWPNLFRACREARVPLAIVNGRIYPGDVRRYALLRSFFARVLDGASWIAVQSELEKERFVAIGAEAARVDVVGSLKIDAARAAAEAPPQRAVVPRVVAASTRYGEERMIEGAMAAIHAPLILAPRHVARAREVEREARRALPGRSVGPPGSGSDVEVVATMGELPRTFRFGDVALVGGSFSGRGGQNPLEAAAAGCAVVAGPDVTHVEPLVALLAERDAIIRCEKNQLASTISELLVDTARRERLGAAARAAVLEAGGAAKRYAAGVVAMKMTR